MSRGIIFSLRRASDDSELVSMRFGSVLHNLREFMCDEFKLEPSDKNKSTMCVDIPTATEMLVAANYILLEHFDSKVERVMNNRFIDILGTLSGEYEKFKYRERFPDDTDVTDFEDNIDMLESIKSMLHVFLFSDDAASRKLAIKVW
jgi:hypothetical protein